MSGKIIAAFRSVPPWLRPVAGLVMLVLIAASAMIWAPLLVGYLFYNNMMHDLKGGEG